MFSVALRSRLQDSRKLCLKKEEDEEEEEEKNSINQSLGPVKYEDENCKGNMCSALSTSCPIKQRCSAVLPWRPHDFNFSLLLSSDEREREEGREKKKRNNQKNRPALFSLFCDLLFGLFFFLVIIKFNFQVLSRGLAEAYMEIGMRLAQQRKARHKLERDDLTAPTQLVPARAL